MSLSSFKFLLFYVHGCIYFMYMYVPVCLCTRCMPGMRLRPEEGTRSQGTRVTYSCELPHERWKQNLDLLKEKAMLLTVESSLQPPINLLASFFIVPGKLRAASFKLMVLGRGREPLLTKAPLSSSPPTSALCQVESSVEERVSQAPHRKYFPSLMSRDF